MSALRLATQDGAKVPVGEDLADHFHAPANESKEDRARRLATARKKKQRLREELARVRLEAVKVPLTLYGGSVAALVEVCQAGGFDEAEEALTLLLHGASDLSKRDPVAFAEFLAPVFAALVVAGADLSKRDRHAFAMLIAPPSHSEGAEDV